MECRVCFTIIFIYIHLKALKVVLQNFINCLCTTYKLFSLIERQRTLTDGSNHTQMHNAQMSLKHMWSVYNYNVHHDYDWLMFRQAFENRSPKVPRFKLVGKTSNCKVTFRWLENIFVIVVLNIMHVFAFQRSQKPVSWELYLVNVDNKNSMLGRVWRPAQFIVTPSS